MPAKFAFVLHFDSGEGLALCGRAKFQSARSALAGKVIDPTPQHEANASLVTCKRCLRLMGLGSDQDQDQDQEEDNFS